MQGNHWLSLAKIRTAEFPVRSLSIPSYSTSLAPLPFLHQLPYFCHSMNASHSLARQMRCGMNAVAEKVRAVRDLVQQRGIQTQLFSVAVGCGIPDLQGIYDIHSGLVLLRQGPFTWREPALMMVTSGESRLWAALFRQERGKAELALLDGRAISLVGGITPEDVVQLTVAMQPTLPGESVLTLTLHANPDVVVEPFLRRLDADFSERCRSLLGLSQWPLVFPERYFWEDGKPRNTCRPWHLCHSSAATREEPLCCNILTRRCQRVVLAKTAFATVRGAGSAPHPPGGDDTQ